MLTLETEVEAYNAHIEEMKTVVAERDNLNVILTEMDQERQRKLGRIQLLKELQERDESDEDSQDPGAKEPHG